MTLPERELRHPTAADLVTDMVTFGVGPHDQRVVHGDWVHYVKVVPRGTHFLSGRGGSGVGGGSVIGDAVSGGVDGLFILIGLVALRGLSAVTGGFTRRGSGSVQAMKVGVVRIPNPKGWKVDRARVVCKYVLPVGADPLPHLDALADRAAAGEWSRTP